MTKTLINIILDRSGSMRSLEEETVSMFNNFLEEQRSGKDEAELSLIQFDNKYEVNYIAKNIKDCEPLLLNETYKPRGWTALLDAIGKTITDVGSTLDALTPNDRPDKVLFVIITDGEENSSKEYTNKQVTDMIEHQQTKYSWDFIFLAAGIDAISEGAKFGLGATKCLSFDFTPQGLDTMRNTISTYASVYRATGNVHMDISDFKVN